MRCKLRQREAAPAFAKKDARVIYYGIASFSVKTRLKPAEQRHHKLAGAASPRKGEAEAPPYCVIRAAEFNAEESMVCKAVLMSAWLLAV